MIILSYLIWVSVCLLAVWLEVRALVFIIFVLFGMHKGILEPVQKAFVSELSPVDFRASAIGLYQMIIGVCAFPASLLAGFLWDEFGLVYPFVLSVGLTLLSITFLLMVKEKGRITE